MESQDMKNWLKLFNTLTETQKRWMCAQRAIEMGFGGITEMRKITGMSRTTITKGIQELKGDTLIPKDRIRNEGAGRKSIKHNNDNLLAALNKIMDENTAGNPMSRIKWTCKSTRNIADELNVRGFQVSYKTVYNLLAEQDYTLQGNKKSIGHCGSDERDAQFQYINSTVNKFIKGKSPVISVDTKKK